MNDIAWKVAQDKYGHLSDDVVERAAEGRLRLDDVRKIIKKEVELCGGQAKLAEKLGVTQTYISDIVLGRREPGPKVLIGLGLEKYHIYVKR